MARVFITGITGFLGSNIARFLIEHGNEVIATYRPESSRALCVDFTDKVTWVEQVANNWIEEVARFKPHIIVHSAWIGVSHNDRNNWDRQYQNVIYLNNVLQIAKKALCTKFIGLGSQAEYGLINGMVAEYHPLNPKEAYGRVKVICTAVIKQYCIHHKIDWYWLRLFSLFGQGESENWLIPALVAKMQTDNEMDFSAGEQKYAYLYAGDLGMAVEQIMLRKGSSGIYNISGKKLLSLKQLIVFIRDKANAAFKLNFGVLPYRENQPMHLQGDCSKFVRAFGEFEISDFDLVLTETISNLMKKNKENK